MTIVDGIAKGHFLAGSPGGQVVGSRVKLVGSGQGAGPIFLCPDHECRGDHWSSADFASQNPSPSGEQKQGIPAETPQHYHLITATIHCQLSEYEKPWILPFIPFIWKLFVGFPVL